MQATLRLGPSTVYCERNKIHSDYGPPYVLAALAFACATSSSGMSSKLA